MNKIQEQIYKLKISKFLTVGFLGSITNISIFFVLVDIMNYSPMLISALGFLIASLQNYMFNHYWTFSDVTNEIPASVKLYFKYLMIALIGLSMNLIVLKIILIYFKPGLKVIGQVFGIISGTMVNFFGSKYWVFNEKT
tara:strand:- start:691 stop:1107 length:417 start_codon:yes stop_codon:yes gene_type:complete